MSFPIASVGDLFREDGLRGIALSCERLSAEVPEQEKDTLLMAADQFRKAAYYMGEPDFFWYHISASGGCTSLGIARIQASLRTEKDPSRSEVLGKYDSILHR
ncbi:hypothetical protein JW826_02245 [Candidatus Woesearchaeota archaeon]|nr:hypothetical protein [Candidatus Woesearchaeota archaeon]